MLLESVEYTRPRSLDQALRALAAREGAAVLAGGQSLVNVLKNRVASVDLLVDVSQLEELRRIERGADGGLEIGACVTYDELERSDEVRAVQPTLAAAAGHIEDKQIRNRGTIGGNCCLSDPSNNLPPLLIALDATMNVQGPDGARTVPAEDFFLGYFMPALEPGEILRSISIPPLASDAAIGYRVLSVGRDSKAIVRAVAHVRSGETIEDARVVLAVVGPRPIRHTAMEGLLNGAPATAETVEHASEAIGDGDGMEPISDAHGSADYRRRMARVLARRAVYEAMMRGAKS